MIINNQCYKNMNDCTKLIDIRIDNDIKFGMPLLNLVAKYEQETDKNVVEHTVTVPLCLYERPVINIECLGRGESCTSVDLGFGFLDNAIIESKVVRVKEKEMTMEELEKALGHKVKIVKEH